MKRRKHRDQLDLFVWAENRPCNVIDADHQFWLRRIRHILFRKRVQLGVYPAPEEKNAVLLEIRHG